MFWYSHVYHSYQHLIFFAPQPFHHGMNLKIYEFMHIGGEINWYPLHWPIVCHGLPSISNISDIRVYIYSTTFVKMNRVCHLTGIFTIFDQKHSRSSFLIIHKFHIVPGLNSSWYHWYLECYKLIICVGKCSPDGRASCICINRRLSVLVNTAQYTVDISRSRFPWYKHWKYYT